MGFPSPESGFRGGDATRFLVRLAEGDESAQDLLFELVYGELRAQAAVQLRDERSDHTLQPTALVNEAWLRMIGSIGVPVDSKRHFVRLAARAMRQILVDHARAARRQKRGGGSRPVTLTWEAEGGGSQGLFDVLSVHEAVDRLRERSTRLADIAELRFFGGLTREEVADALGVSRTTVARDWRAARAMLADFLKE